MDTFNSSSSFEELSDSLEHTDSLVVVSHTQSTVNTTLDNHPVEKKESSEIIFDETGFTIDGKRIESLEDLEEYDSEVHRKVMRFLLENGHLDGVVENIEKFHGVEDMHKEIAEKFLKSGQPRSILLDNVDKFHGIEDLYEQIINVPTDGFCDIDNIHHAHKFGIAEQKRIVEIAIQNRHLYDVIDNIENFDVSIIRQVTELCIKDWGSISLYTSLDEVFAGNLEKFQNIDDLHPQIAMLILEQKAYQNLIENLEKFHGIEDLYEQIIDKLAGEQQFFRILLIQNAHKFGIEEQKRIVRIAESNPLFIHVIENIEKFGTEIMRYTAEKCMENGYIVSFTENLNKFHGIEDLHPTIAKRLIDHGEIEVLVKNLEKFVGIESLHRELFTTLVDRGEFYDLLNALQKFQGIEDLHRGLAEHLLENGKMNILVAHIQKFHGIEDLHRPIIERWMQDPDSAQLANNLEKFQRIEDLHRSIAEEYMRDGSYETLAIHLQKFHGIEERHRSIVEGCIKGGFYDTLVSCLEKFHGIEDLHMKIAENLLNKDSILTLVENLKKFHNIEYLYTRMLEEMVMGGHFEHILNMDDTFQGINPKLISFLKKLKGREADMETMKRIPEVVKSIHNFSNIFNYFIEYKQKEFLPFIRSMLSVQDEGVRADLQPVTNLTKTEWMDDMDFSEVKPRLVKQYAKLLGEINESGSEKKIASLERFLSLQKGVSEEVKQQLAKNWFGPAILAYHYQHLKVQINKMFRSEFPKLSPEKTQALWENTLFMDAFRMYRKANINKKQFKSILDAFVQNENPDDVRRLLDNEKNNAWKEKMEKKGVNMKAFLSEHRETVEVSGLPELHGADQDINHHIRVAGDKLEDLGFERFETAGKLIEWYQKYVKKPDIQEELFRKLHEEKGLLREVFDTILADIALQVESIQKLNTNRKAKEITSLTMYRETDPMRVLMMGNWVDGSCLSFYSSVGNFWSTATNALDINKAVYYIEDQDGNIVGRVLVAIDDVKKLVRFRTYKKGNISVHLDTYFDPYIKKIAKESGLGLNGRQWDVDPLNGEKWYMDGEEGMGE